MGNIYRGTVWWWNCPAQDRSHIQRGTRPVVVVSNDHCNLASPVVTVAPVSTHAKRPYPQQVGIVLPDGISVVLCDQLTSIPVEELGKYICTLKDYQMDQVDTAIAVQLGLVDIEDRPYALFRHTEE